MQIKKEIEGHSEIDAVKMIDTFSFKESDVATIDIDIV